MKKNYLATILVALSLVILLIAIAYSSSRNAGITNDKPVVPSPFSTSTQNVVCTEEAKLCPDGSYVARTGPHCEFASCPSVNSLLTEPQARVIAEKSCIKGGEALAGGTYNSMTKTWWYDANLNSIHEGCNPACVVDEKTQTAEINWRCTGLKR
jgi:hypothetical protein